MTFTLEEIQNELREPQSRGELSGFWDFLSVIETREEPLESASNWLRKPETQIFLGEKFLNQVVMVYGEKVVGAGGDLGLARDSAAKEGFDPDDCLPYFVEYPSVR